MSVGRQLSVVGFMLALAAIDFGGALVAQDFADRRRLSTLLVGSGLSIALFVVYAVALRLADLSIVTMGWIVMLQVALIAWDVVRHGLHLNAVQWAAVASVIVLQVFLTATTQQATRRPEPVRASGRSDLGGDDAGALAGHEEDDPAGDRDGVVGRTARSSGRTG